jgi:hypothetical protein
MNNVATRPTKSTTAQTLDPIAKTGLCLEDLRVGRLGEVPIEVGSVRAPPRAAGPDVRCPAGDRGCD